MKASTFIIAAAGLLLGLLAGRMFPPGSTPGGKAPASTAAAVSPARSAPTGAKKPAISADKRSFAALCRLYPRIAKDNAEIRRAFERMDAAELHEALGSLAAEYAVVPAEQADGFSATMTMALEELYKRDGEQALLWADDLPNTLHRRWFLYQLIEAANYDSPELAQPWVKKLKSEEMSFAYGKATLNGAVERGADELIRLQQLFGKDLRGQVGNEGFPDDFDFKRLITGMPVPSSENGVSLDQAIGYWAAEDRKAAWAGIEEAIAKDQAAGCYVGGYFKGLCGMDGNAKAAAELAGKLGELPAEARDSAFQALSGGEYIETAMELIPVLKDEANRVKIAARYVDPHDNSDRGWRALEKLGSDALREQALTQVAQRYSQGLSDREGDEHTAMVRAYFAQAMEKTRLSKESRARVEAALAQPRQDAE
ncbi:hypothetical protein [Haloferula sp. BvORR071]|uniref:hypothetical protein n=1 Tax=Haloferula sp. BvORR071 TaxID=1396141 RepID=UPI00054DB730|nr:hypothetical protein [Haloferula sp. BvORR071]